MRTSESAVSSVVGTVLMLGITVMVFTAFSVVALSYFHSQPHAPRKEQPAEAKPKPQQEQPSLVLMPDKS